MNMDEIRIRVRGLVKDKRWPHVEGCAEMAAVLADRWGADREKAEAAALLHDCTKAVDISGQLYLCKQYDIITKSSDRLAPQVLHALTAAEKAKREFQADDEIYGAIRWHTTGRAEMTLLEKIIYIADIAEKTRNFPGLDEIRRAAAAELDSAVMLAAGATITHIISRREFVHPDTFETYNFYSQSASKSADNRDA